MRRICVTGDSGGGELGAKNDGDGVIGRCRGLVWAEVGQDEVAVEGKLSFNWEDSTDVVLEIICSM